jgi:ABC-type polar amino acid transport system ATPase subunit
MPLSLGFQQRLAVIEVAVACRIVLVDATTAARVPNAVNWIMTA